VSSKSNAPDFIRIYSRLPEAGCKAPCPLAFFICSLAFFPTLSV